MRKILAFIALGAVAYFGIPKLFRNDAAGKAPTPPVAAPRGKAPVAAPAPAPKGPVERPAEPARVEAAKAAPAPSAPPAAPRIPPTKSLEDLLWEAPASPDAALQAGAILLSQGKREAARDALSDAWKASEDPAARKRLAAKLSEFAPALAFSQEKTSDCEFVIVAPGDALEKIARKCKSAVGLIRRVNGVQGDRIFPGDRLKVFQGPPELLVRKSDFTLTYLLRGRFVKQWTVGIGKFDKTPEGSFAIATKKEKPDWTFRGEVIPFGDARNILGTRWLGFAPTAEHKGYGIHGSANGEGVGAESSNGCIRMRNEEVEELFDLVPYGTPATIKR